MASSLTTHDHDAPLRVVHAAWEVLADEGPRGATMRVIANRAGASTGLLTHHWDSKAEIMAAVLAYNNRIGVRRIAQAVGDESGLAALRAASLALLPTDEEGSRLWRVWVGAWTAPTDDSSADGLRAGWAGLRAIVVGMFEQAVADGDLAGIDPAREASRLVAMIAGAGLGIGAGAPTADADVAVEMLLDHLDGLAAAAQKDRE